MQIRVELSMVQKFQKFIQMGEYKNKAKCELFIEGLTDNIGFQKMMEFYNGAITKNEYIEIVYSGFNQLDYYCESQAQKLMHSNFMLLIQNKKLLNKKIDLIKSYNFNKFQQALKPTLPSNTPINADIHFVVDGINAGSIVDAETMLMYIMIWPSKEKYLDLIEGIILHEYHHLGLKYWLDKDPIRELLLSRKNNQSALLKLSDALMSEGAATYFFNQGHNMYPLLIESYGNDFAKKYQNAINQRNLSKDAMLIQLEQDLKTIIDNKVSYSEMIDILNQYTFNADGGEPKDKNLGCHMCKMIDRELGRAKLIEIFLKPTEFLLTYNQASAKTDAFQFQQSTIKSLERMLV
ncbi:DUF5700 domain-containing putative Zn-dependent protease [Proteinivorax tanatarense]|uniref:DUF5700 domain-containing putative Zn-dependent protease n=1 Tax=Proteinivorax tanatarense TaxID=1260629 RepID=A0AAU7VNB7_9FIRM